MADNLAKAIKAIQTEYNRLRKDIGTLEGKIVRMEEKEQSLQQNVLNMESNS